MSRTRAERRHNTRVKADRRKALVSTDCVCAGKVAPNGEATSCPLCVTSDFWNVQFLEREVRERDKAWQLAQF